LLSITVFRDGKRVKGIDTERDEIVIGRDASCDVPLDDKTVSRRHAKMTRVVEGVLVEDLGSRNGTYVGGEQIKTHRLAPGESVTVGGYTLSVRGVTEITGARPKTAERPAETAILSTLDARSVGKGEDVREGKVDREAMVSRLSALYDLGQKLCGRLAMLEIAETFLDLLMAVFSKADRAVMLVEDRQTRNLVPLAARERGSSGAEPRISRTVVDTVLNEKQAVICGDTGSDARFKHSVSLQDLKIRAIMCAPLIVSDRVLGMVEVDCGAGGISFSEDDLRLLTGLASQVSIAMENSRLYREVEHSRRLAAIGQTVSGVAHCVKNVLNGIDGGLFIARKGLGDRNEEKIAKGWDMLQRNSSFLKGLVLDMLDYSKDRPPEYQEVDVPALFEEIMAFVQGRATEGGIDLSLAIAEGIGKVNLDPTRMKRALLNIVANAVEATPEGGRVTVTIAPVRTGWFSVNITDTGKGIPADMMKTIFEPFVSTKGSKGTGLGLPVMKKIVEEHGGEVHVESEVGKGTTFGITLPTAPRAT
jgi:signal transduction histidine kinase